jgi:hypothetical protein
MLVMIGVVYGAASSLSLCLIVACGVSATATALRVCSPGSDWPQFEMYCASVSSVATASTFMWTYYVLSNFVVMSLFISVILSNFDDSEEEIRQKQQAAYDRLAELVARTCSPNALPLPLGFPPIPTSLFLVVACRADAP